MVTKIGINGVGRIARAVLRIAHQKEDVQVTAINSTRDLELLAHLLQYDSVHGRFPGEVKAAANSLIIDEQRIALLSDRDPKNLDWDKHGVEIVVEATGKFMERELAAKHLGGTAKKVVITAPGKKTDNTIVMGVNHKSYDPATDVIISNASCTTNCLAPVVKVLNDAFGIEYAMMTAVHAYTKDQMLLDGTHDDPRRARAANLSIVPTSTGAARAVSEVLPDMEGKIDGMSFRVPIPNVSTIDLVATLAAKTSVDEVNNVFRKAKDGSLKGILDYTDLPLVSADFRGNPNSAVIDGESTMQVGANMIKVVAWYDNEWAYSARVVDLCEYISKETGHYK